MPTAQSQVFRQRQCADWKSIQKIIDRNGLMLFQNASARFLYFYLERVFSGKKPGSGNLQSRPACDYRAGGIFKERGTDRNRKKRDREFTSGQKSGILKYRFLKDLVQGGLMIIWRRPRWSSYILQI